MPKDYSKFKKNKPIYLDKKGVVTKAGERSSEVSEKLNIERKQAQEKEKKGERGAVFTQHKKEKKRKKERERELEKAKKTKDEMNKRNQEEVQRKNYEIKETIRLNQEKEKKGFDIKEYRERETLGGKAVKTITDLKTTAVLTTALGILSGYGIATGALKIGGGAAGTTGVQGVITHSVTAFGKTQVAQRAITGKVIHQTPKALQKLYSTTPSITKYVTNGKTLSLTKALLTKTFDTIKNPGFIIGAIGSYPFANFIKEESLQTLSMPIMKAISEGDLETAKELNLEVDKMLNNQDGILEKIPFVNVYEKLKDFFQASGKANDAWKQIIIEIEKQQEEELNKPTFAEEREMADKEARERELEYREEDEKYYEDLEEERKREELEEMTWKSEYYDLIREGKYEEADELLEIQK